MPKIPLIVAVVGALLVGGATTGTTRASWADQKQLAATTVKSGTMAIVATPPAARQSVTVGGPAVVVAGTLKDDSLDNAPNLQQAMSWIGLSTWTAGIQVAVEAKGSAPCTVAAALQSSNPATPVSLGTTTWRPSSEVLPVCITLKAVSGAPAGDRSLSLAFAGNQARTGFAAGQGWASSASMAVDVSVKNPVLTCSVPAGTKNEVTLSWTNPTGTTRSQVHYASDTLGSGLVAAPGGDRTPAATSYAMTHVGGNNDAYTRYYRITFTVGSTTSVSNWVAITRNGSNGNGNMSCVGA